MACPLSYRSIKKFGDFFQSYKTKEVSECSKRELIQARIQRYRDYTSHSAEDCILQAESKAYILLCLPYRSKRTVNTIQDSLPTF